MASEYIVDLCFVRPETSMATPFPGMEEHMDLLFTSDAHSFVDRKREEGMDIAVAQISGLTAVWSTEQEVITHMENHMQQDQMEWLCGYRVQLIPKVDAGTCCMKR